MSDIRIIGIGNVLAGDDAIGISVAQQLKADNLKGIDILEMSQGGVGLLDLMDGAETVILIDAVKSGKPPGTIFCLESPDGMDQISNLARFSLTSSTHAFGLNKVLALGQTLERLPPTLILYGIELDQVDLGKPPSQKIIQAGERVQALIAHRLRGGAHDEPHQEQWQKHLTERP